MRRPVLVLLLLATTACGGGDDTNADPATTSAAGVAPLSPASCIDLLVDAYEEVDPEPFSLATSNRDEGVRAAGVLEDMRAVHSEIDDECTLIFGGLDSAAQDALFDTLPAEIVAMFEVIDSMRVVDVDEGTTTVP
jgi:hypothetical protein